MKNKGEYKNCQGGATVPDNDEAIMVNESQEKLIITFTEAAEMIGVCGNTLRQLLRRKGAPVIMAGRRLIIPRKPFIQWIEGLAIGRINEHI